jgi:DNA primase catalytic subunit
MSLYVNYRTFAKSRTVIPLRKVMIMSRTHEIRVKVTEEEYENIKLNADILDMPIATYIRMVAQNPTIIHFNYDAIERHTEQVGKIVNSVNQLIFTIEVNNDYQPKEIDGIMDSVNEIMKTENELLRTVRKQWEDTVKGRAILND